MSRLFSRLILTTSLITLCSCYSVNRPRAVGLYGPEPVKQSIPGSNAQAIVDRQVEFNSEEVFEASKTALLRLGYIVEEQKPEQNFINGSGRFNCGADLFPAVTMAIYIEQLDTLPLTKFTIVLDRHEWICWGFGEEMAANEVAREIQKVLATF